MSDHFSGLTYKGYEETPETVIRIYTVDNGTDDPFSLIPPRYASDPLGKGWHDNTKAQVMQTGTPYAQLRLTFSKLSMDSGNATPLMKASDKTNGQIDWDIQYNWINKPLETHKNYEARWNYDLYCTCKQTSVNNGMPVYETIASAPSWWSTAKAFTVAEGQTDSNRQWQFATSRPPSFKAPDDKNVIWRLCQARTMAGVSFYPYMQPIIIAKVTVDNYDRALLLMKGGGELIAPKNTYGYPKDNKYWKKKPQGIDMNDKFWTVNVHYEYADGGYDGRLNDGGVMPQ